jgi:hypothetical protein
MVIDMVLATRCIRDLCRSKGAAAKKRCSKGATPEKVSMIIANAATLSGY